MHEFYNAFKTGVFYYHKLISTVTKSGSFKGPPRVKSYRCNRSFNIETFKHTLSDKRSNLKNS